MYYLGIDLGGTNIACGLTDENGSILIKKSVPAMSHRNYKEVMKDMASACFSVVKEYGIEISDVKGAGIGTPGLSDITTGIVIASANLNMQNAPLSSELFNYLNIPVYLGNDANCAALGESTLGAAREKSNSVTITLGTGIGGGIIIDNKIYTGSNFCAGEIGHHVIVVDGEKCGCGRRGCWERYASATAIIEFAKRAMVKNNDCLIYKKTGGDIDKVNAKLVFDCAEDGDDVAIKLIADYYKYLTTGVVNVINILQPDILVIGGGISAQGMKLISKLKENIAKEAYGHRDDANKVEIKLAELGNDAGIIGAAMLCKQ